MSEPMVCCKCGNSNREATLIFIRDTMVGPYCEQCAEQARWMVEHARKGILETACNGDGPDVIVVDPSVFTFLGKQKD